MPPFIPFHQAISAASAAALASGAAPEAAAAMGAAMNQHFRDIFNDPEAAAAVFRGDTSHPAYADFMARFAAYCQASGRNSSFLIIIETIGPDFCYEIRTDEEMLLPCLKCRERGSKSTACYSAASFYSAQGASSPVWGASSPVWGASSTVWGAPSVPTNSPQQ